MFYHLEVQIRIRVNTRVRNTSLYSLLGIFKSLHKCSKCAVAEKSSGEDLDPDPVDSGIFGRIRGRFLFHWIRNLTVTMDMFHIVILYIYIFIYCCLPNLSLFFFHFHPDRWEKSKEIYKNFFLKILYSREHGTYIR